eukprot:5254776-Amphidinium_carterae.2
MRVRAAVRPDTNLSSTVIPKPKFPYVLASGRAVGPSVTGVYISWKCMCSSLAQWGTHLLSC